MGIGVYDFLMEFCFLTADARLKVPILPLPCLPHRAGLYYKN